MESSIPTSSSQRPVWLFRFACLVALATLGLVCIGGLVTSKGVGMSVPYWPTSFGYSMFALPISMWMTGGVFHEHTHRVWASGVGLLVVFLARWTAGSGSRKTLAGVGLAEVVAGLLLMRVNPLWKGEAHFLLGIGGVVLAAAAVGFKNAPASPLSVRLAWAAFWLVQIQGSLGGLRVVLDSWAIGGTTGGTVFGMILGCLAFGLVPTVVPSGRRYSRRPLGVFGYRLGVWAIDPRALDASPARGIGYSGFAPGLWSVVAKNRS